jgi:hypothetical protein
MKSPFMKSVVAGAVILTSPIVTFAGGQPARYYYTPRKGEVQKPAGRSWDRRALGVKFNVEPRRRGKNARMGSADRVVDIGGLGHFRANWGDSAFRK